MSTRIVETTTLEHRDATHWTPVSDPDNAVASSEFYARLKEILPGLPKRATKVVITLETDKAVTLHIESLGTDGLERAFRDYVLVPA